MNAPIFVYEEILETECLKTGESTTDPMGGSEPDKDELLQEGSMLPDMLLPDVPVNINGYTPQNFSMQYEGASSCFWSA